ncbi:hypothetical protein VNO77_02356 [Canavalia gladiata]|uniref:Uncharacterized protein n=1 Tax=Canavalia gladiata TaxID=3824 RepID=A0AAN9MZA7_CANGL
MIQLALLINGCRKASRSYAVVSINVTISFSSVSCFKGNDELNNGRYHSQRSPLLAELIETRLIRTVSLRADLREIALPMARYKGCYTEPLHLCLGIISGVDEKRAFGYIIVGFQVVPCSIEHGPVAMAEHYKYDTFSPMSSSKRA